MRVAVVGGGIFGVTAAVRIARAGGAVDLFEKNHDLLAAASGINQYRLHRGYHYPRSSETAVGCRDSELAFRSEYGASVVDANEHYYAIAARDSLIDAREFLAFCDRHRLEYVVDAPKVLRPEPVETCIRVRESLFDPVALRQIAWRKVQEAGVRVHLGRRALPEDLTSYDHVVLATYADNNRFVPPHHRREYQFELCEKPVVRLPSAFAATSVVVMDGPFMCLDPLGSTGLHVLGNVVHAIHDVHIGETPRFPLELRRLLDRGIIADPPTTNFSRFVESGVEFFPLLREAEHVGSMFTVRTVLPRREATDERPTLVERLDARTVAVFSGKIATCVKAADDIHRAIVEGTSRLIVPAPSSKEVPL